MVVRCNKSTSISELAPMEMVKFKLGTSYVNFDGQFLCRMCFVMIDAHSKWSEVVELKSTIAEQTVQVMHSVLARNGLCKIPVSDNVYSSVVTFC